MDQLLKDSTFRCRKCRVRLFSVDKLQSHKDQKLKWDLAAGPVDLSSYDKCSSWFLNDEDMLPWINESVEEAQWTEGKLYCPKCKSRIGAFDFIHGIQCNCGKFIIPAVWIQKSRVDHILPKSQTTNLDIRKPALNPDQSMRTHSDVVTSAVVHNAMHSLGGNVQEFDDIVIDSTHNLKRDGDSLLKFASSSTSQCSNCTDEENEGKDNGQAESSCNSSPSVNWESASSSCDLFIPLERNFTTPPQDSNMSHQIGLNVIDQCEQCYDAKSHVRQAHPVIESENFAVTDQRTQRLPSQRSCSCTCSTCVDALLESNSSSRGAVHILNNKESHVQRSKRKRKGRHPILLENADIHVDLHAEMNIEPQVTQAGDQRTYYSCLTVDEGFEESMKTGIKVATAEIQDRHCCAVCLDLLYEPFKCSCDHVFCDPCLRQLNFRTNSKGTIKCPLCRQIVEHITPATELRREIRSTYDSHILRKRDKAERRAPHRKWPLPANHGRLKRVASRPQRSVTLPCVISTFLMCACVYTLVMIALMSNLAANDVIMMY